MTGGKWTDQEFEWTGSQSRHCHLKEHKFRGKESSSKISTNSEPLLDVRVAMQSKTTKGHRTVITPQGAETWNRRNEVINEALAEEIHTGEQRKKRSKNTAAV